MPKGSESLSFTHLENDPVKQTNKISWRGPCKMFLGLTSFLFRFMLMCTWQNQTPIFKHTHMQFFKNTLAYLIMIIF